MQMAKTRVDDAALAYLKRDRFRHIMILKYWQAYAAHARMDMLADGSRIGVRLLVPTRQSPWDRRTYAGTQLVAFVRADDASLTQALIADLPHDQGIIFKLVDPLAVEAVRSKFRVARQTAFISFTAPLKAPAWPVHADVAIARQPPAGTLPLYAQQGYEAAEVTAFAAANEGRFYWSADATCEPVGACFSFANFETIHEIGGLFTLPSARRTGIARRLVETALATLQHESQVPRYQVHEDNAPSIALATAVGLVPAVTAEHWLYQP